MLFMLWNIDRTHFLLLPLCFMAPSKSMVCSLLGLLWFLMHNAMASSESDRVKQFCWRFCYRITQISYSSLTCKYLFGCLCFKIFILVKWFMRIVRSELGSTAYLLIHNDCNYILYRQLTCNMHDELTEPVQALACFESWIQHSHYV